MNEPMPPSQTTLSGVDVWFPALFKNSADAMALIDPESGVFVACNDASAKAIHAPHAGALLGRRPADLTDEFLPDGRRSAEAVEEIMAKVLREGSHRFEWCMRRLDGTRTWSEVVATAVTLDGKTLISTTSRNIEARKRMEEEVRQLNQSLEQRISERTAELRFSEDRFKQLFELSPLGMARVSWDGHFRQVNRSFARMLGYEIEEVLRLSYWDITPREYEAQEQEILRQVKASGKFGPFEKEYIHRDGRPIPIVLNGMLIQGADGADELWGITQDVTGRKQAEQALRESERKFRVLFETSSQGVMLHDERHHFADVNQAAADIFGLKPADLLGRHPAEFAPEWQPDGQRSEDVARRQIQACLEHGIARFEWTHLHARGHEVLMEVVLSRITDGERQLMQAVVTDISERKRAEMELKRALERERELHQLKSDFVSMVSHEFRTPLGIIQSSAEILADYLEQLEPEERREQLQSIIHSSGRMARLMEEVLLLGRLEANRMQFKPAPLDLAALCRCLVDEMQSAMPHEVRIEFFTADLPMRFLADESLLRHILLNLLSNAVKYSEAGQTVTFLGRSTASGVEFVIQDRGIGIPAAELEHLFTAFQRGSNVGQRPGTGLGLMIVKRCLELHGGTLTLDSQPQQGTTAIVNLPQPSSSPES